MSDLQDMDKLFRDSMQEMKALLDRRGVIGDPITVEGRTIVPLLSVGFGFGVGQGSGAPSRDVPEGSGGGVGAGGGVRPIALVVIDEKGVRLERVAHESGMAGVATAVARAVSERATGSTVAGPGPSPSAGGT